MLLGKKPDWREVESFIVESYRIIAPKKRVKELDARGGGAKPAPAARTSANAKKRRA
jgi:hypothetical protein